MDKKVIALTQNLPVPVRIVIETRRAARISLRKKQIILRLPKKMNAEAKYKVAAELLEWANKTITNKNLYLNVNNNPFKEGTAIEILGHPYTIEHQPVPGNSTSMLISTANNKVVFHIPIHLSNEEGEQKKKLIEGVFIKGLNQFFIHEIRRRVHELNRLHFNADIDKISLRYTTSRWGSCSSNGNISLSTKLLLVPPIVCDYVIIHELAHRFEMNHSKDFWNLVEQAMPNYKKHILWLKEEGASLII